MHSLVAPEFPMFCAHDDYSFVWVLYLFVPQPEYKGPAKIEYLVDREFERKVENAPPTESWIVLFYAHWAYDCNQFMVLYSELSLLYPF